MPWIMESKNQKFARRKANHPQPQLWFLQNKPVEQSRLRLSMTAAESIVIAFCKKRLKENWFLQELIPTRCQMNKFFNFCLCQDFRRQKKSVICQVEELDLTWSNPILKKSMPKSISN